jgi:hypothetical protein
MGVLYDYLAQQSTLVLLGLRLKRYADPEPERMPACGLPHRAVPAPAPG